VQSEIISSHTGKAKGRDGEWSVVLSSGQNYKSMLHAGCWCLIFISDRPLTPSKSPKITASSGLKMLGIVKSVRAIETLDGSTGTRTLRYEVHGTDFNSILHTQVYINEMLAIQGAPETEAIKNAANLFRGMNPTDLLAPERMVGILIDAILGKGADQGFQISAGPAVGGVVGLPADLAMVLNGYRGDLKFVSSLRRKFYTGLLGFAVPQPQISSNYSLWSMMSSYSHPILNELYTDLIPFESGGAERLAPTIVMRPIPFSSRAGLNSADDVIQKAEVSKKVSSLPTLSIQDSLMAEGVGDVALYVSKRISEDEILSMNYGKSDSERFNFFYVSPNIALKSGAEARNFNELVTGGSGMSSLGDPNSIARHGLRPFISVSGYVNQDSDSVAHTNIIVRDMWSKAHLFENGTVAIVGQERHIPVGTNIVFSERNWAAHVEQVSHTYGVDPSGRKEFVTAISFVRLQNMRGQPVDLVEGARSGQRGGFDRGYTRSGGNDQ
jgi:hypothetical protein